MLIQHTCQIQIFPVPPSNHIIQITIQSLYIRPCKSSNSHQPDYIHSTVEIIVLKECVFKVDVL